MIGIVRMSVTAAVLIAAILLLRWRFLEKLPKRTFKILWVIAAARMLIPFSAPILPQIGLAQEQTAQTAVQHEQSNFNIIYDVVELESTRGESAEFDRRELAAAMWMFGAAAVFVGFLANHSAHKKRYAASLPCRSKLISDHIDSFGLRRKIIVKVSDETDSPMTYGTFKPVIILPQSTLALTAGKQKAILTHEVMHIAKFDIFLKWTLIAAVSLNWFNPLAWVMLVIADRDIELCCDEAVLKYLGDGRKAYAMTLIDMEERRVPAMFAGFGSSSVKERIVAIMKFKKTTFAAAAASICLIAGSMSVFAMERADKPQEFSAANDKTALSEFSSEAETAAEENTAEAQTEQSEETYTTEAEIEQGEGDINIALSAEDVETAAYEAKVNEALAKLGITADDNGGYFYNGKPVAGMMMAIDIDDENRFICQTSEVDNGVYLVDDKAGGVKEVSKEEFEDTFTVSVEIADDGQIVAKEDGDYVGTYSYEVTDEVSEGIIDSEYQLNVYSE